VLYDAYYEELEQYANHQQQYQSSGGKISPPPGPGPFPGSVALDKNGVVIGGPPVGKHPTRGARPAVNGNRGRKAPTDSADEYEDDDYEDDDEDYDDEDEEEEDEDDEDDDDSNERKLAQRRRGPTRGSLSRRTNGREDFFNFGSLTAAGPGNILTVADDLLKNDGGKFLEMMEQLAERRMQRDEEAAKEVEMESDEEDDEGEGSEEEDDEDVDDDDDESEEEEDVSSQWLRFEE
jgi:Salt tolerance down-regulator